jgi:hypothetical protein
MLVQEGREGDGMSGLVGQIVTNKNDPENRYRVEAQDGITLTLTNIVTGKQSPAYLLGTFICFEVTA